MQISLVGRATITGTIQTNDAGWIQPSTLLNKGSFGLRSFPFSSICSSSNVLINNDSFSQPLYQTIHCMENFSLCSDMMTRDYSMTPNLPDQSQSYSQVTGTNRNPLNVYGDSMQGVPQGRGEFITIVQNPVISVPTLAPQAVTCIVDFFITENIYVSPLAWSRNDKQGLWNISSLDFNFSLLNNGMRLFSQSNAPINSSGLLATTGTIQSITLQFNNFVGAPFSYAQTQPLMSFRYLTPNLLQRQNLSANHPISYPYSELVPYLTDFGSAITFAGPAVSVTSNSMFLNSIPKRIFVFARPSDNTLQNRCDICDAYLQLQNIEISWGNTQSILGSCTPQQLYRINVSNGYSRSFAEWSCINLPNSAFLGTTGSGQIQGPGGPLCLEMSKDVPLGDPSLAPGVTGQFQLTVKGTFKNVNSTLQWDTVPMTMFVIVMNEGVATSVARGDFSHKIGVLSQKDVLDSSMKEPIVASEPSSGGDWLSSLGSFFNKANSFLKDSKLISTLAPLIPLPGSGVVSSAANALGYGAIRGGCGDQGQFGYGSGAIQGGKRVTKADMRRMLSDR